MMSLKVPVEVAASVREKAGGRIQKDFPGAEDLILRIRERLRAAIIVTFFLQWA